MDTPTDKELLNIARLTLSYMLEYGITEKDIRELRDTLGYLDLRDEYIAPRCLCGL